MQESPMWPFYGDITSVLPHPLLNSQSLLNYSSSYNFVMSRVGHKWNHRECHLLGSSFFPLSIIKSGFSWLWVSAVHCVLSWSAYRYCGILNHSPRRTSEKFPVWEGLTNKVVTNVCLPVLFLSEVFISLG